MNMRNVILGLTFLPMTNRRRKKSIYWCKLTQDTALDRGGSPVPVGEKSSNSGRIRGSSVSHSGTVSSLSSKKMTGIGSPQ